MKLEQLNETLKNPVKYVWNVKSDTLWKGVFQIDNNLYEFYAINSEGLPGGSIDSYWELGFQFKNEDAISLQKLTGTGNEFQVFSTVITMMMDFGKKMKPREVRIHADPNDSTTRETLYRRMLNRFALTTGYDFKEKTVNKLQQFILTRKDAA